MSQSWGRRTRSDNRPYKKQNSAAVSVSGVLCPYCGKTHAPGSDVEKRHLKKATRVAATGKLYKNQPSVPLPPEDKPELKGMTPDERAWRIERLKTAPRLLTRLPTREKLRSGEIVQASFTLPEEKYGAKYNKEVTTYAQLIQHRTSGIGKPTDEYKVATVTSHEFLRDDKGKEFLGYAVNIGGRTDFDQKFNSYKLLVGELQRGPGITTGEIQAKDKGSAIAIAEAIMKHSHYEP